MKCGEVIYRNPADLSPLPENPRTITKAQTVTHELGHATWNTSLSGANHKAAGKEIRSLYKTWMKDKKKTGYGKYATTNVDEFWAETVTKAVHGKSDKYTTKVKEICKKYKL